MDTKKLLRGPALWIALAVIAVIIGTSVIGNVSGPQDVNTSQVVTAIQQNKVTEATITDKDQRIEVTLTDGSKIRAQYVEGQGVQLQNLLQSKVDSGSLKGGYNVDVPHDNILMSLLYTLLPMFLVLGLLFFFMGQMQGGGGRIMNFGKSRAKMVSKDMPKTTFADVAGADEAVEELESLVLVLVERIALRHAAPADDLPQMVEHDEVLAPQMIQRLQQHHLLDLAQGLAAEGVFLGVIGFAGEPADERRLFHGDPMLRWPPQASAHDLKTTETAN